MRREDYMKLRDLIDESIDTGRPIECRCGDGTWKTWSDLGLAKAIDHYRVQPAPPQSKFRPMNHEELMNEVDRGTVVYGKSIHETDIRGPLIYYNKWFMVANAYAALPTLRFANPSDPRCGQPLQVEIKDDPQ